MLTYVKNQAGTRTVEAFDEQGQRVTGDRENITASISADGGSTASMIDIDDTDPTESKLGHYVFTITAGERDADSERIYPVSTTPGVTVVASPPAMQAVSVATADIERTGGMLALTKLAVEAIKIVTTKLAALITGDGAGTPYAVKTDTASRTASKADVSELGGGQAISADQVSKNRTFFGGREGNHSDNIITLNTWASGTITLCFDLDDDLNGNSALLTVESVTAINDDNQDSIATTGLKRQADHRHANFDVAAIASAGVYTVKIVVTTTDSNTLTKTGTLTVGPN